MNQENIGKFILELRREKGLTQMELADKLGVTDKAVSKWENGRCMPDLSLIKPLCDILDISINELLSGKRLTKEEYQKQLEENIIEINLTTLKKNTIKTIKIVLMTILSIIALCILLILSFIIKTEYDHKHIELDEDKVTFNICKYNDSIMIEPIYNDYLYVGYNIEEDLENEAKIITSVYRERKYYINPKLIKKDNIGTAKVMFNKMPKKIYYKDKLIWDFSMGIDGCYKE